MEGKEMTKQKLGRMVTLGRVANEYDLGDLGLEFTEVEDPKQDRFRIELEDGQMDLLVLPRGHAELVPPGEPSFFA